MSYEANIWHDGKSEKTLGVIDFTFTLKASDDNWKISAITREGDEEWIEDAKTSSAKKTGTTVVSELKRLLNEELAKAKALPHTKMLYGTPIDPKETQVLNTSVEDTKASSMRNALIVAYDANKAVNYSDCYALTENSLFYVADKDCTNFVSQCVWAGYGGWVMVMRLPMHKTLQLTTACIITITVIGIRPVGLHTKTVVAARGKVQHHMEILL